MVWGLADGTVLVNPGSPTMPYGYLGIAGTVGFIDIDEGGFEVTILDLRTGAVELELAGPGPHPSSSAPGPPAGADRTSLAADRPRQRRDLRQPAQHVVEVRAALNP